MITIRKLETVDINAFVDCYKEMYLFLNKKPLIDCEKLMLWAFELIKNENGTIFIAVENRIVGFVALISGEQVDGTTTVLVEPFWVSTDYHNMGVAIRLIRVALDWIDEKKAKYAYGFEDVEGGAWTKHKSLGFKPYKMMIRREYENT